MLLVLFITSALNALEIPKCPEPELNPGTKLKVSWVSRRKLICAGNRETSMKALYPYCISGLFRSSSYVFLPQTEDLSSVL